MEGAEIQDSRLPGDLGGDPHPAHRQFGIPDFRKLEGLLIRDITIDPGLFGVFLEDRADGIMGPHPLQVQHGRLDDRLINLTAIARFGEIALGLFQALQKGGLDFGAAEVLHEGKGAAGVMDDLDRFDSGQVVEKPAATGVHQHGAALHPHELEDRNLVLVRRAPGRRGGSGSSPRSPGCGPG